MMRLGLPHHHGMAFAITQVVHPLHVFLDRRLHRRSDHPASTLLGQFIQ
jgi:hypothetical protein